MKNTHIVITDSVADTKRSTFASAVNPVAALNAIDTMHATLSNMDSFNTTGFILSRSSLLAISFNTFSRCEYTKAKKRNKMHENGKIIQMNTMAHSCSKGRMTPTPELTSWKWPKLTPSWQIYTAMITISSMRKTVSTLSMSDWNLPTLSYTMKARKRNEANIAKKHANVVKARKNIITSW
mmetsp:Transcript_75214/g.119589  ORF Transcript_75214/g.119589 Transcript_75214/m.119589 type:complete len:181 (-) Transcript_75214:195-737(-)